MRPTVGLLTFALALLGCTDDGSADTSETAADEPGTEDDVGSESASETTGDGDGDGDDVPDCTPGAFGCTCGEGDSCSPDLVCTEGMCTFSDCSVGYDGCPCAEGGVCNEGLFCVDDTCGCMPGSLGCGCTDATDCGDGLECISGACWLPSAYPNCGWDDAHGYYYCGFDIAHPDFPIDCPVGLIEGDPCPADLTFVGCCDMTGTWWCQGTTTTYAAC